MRSIWENVQSFGDAFVSSDDAPKLAQFSWVRLDGSGGSRATLAVVASGFAFRDQLGERLRLALHTERPDFSSGRNWLELRDASGTLVLWIASAGSVAT